MTCMEISTLNCFARHCVDKLNMVIVISHELDGWEVDVDLDCLPIPHWVN